ncbi:MAG: hypothetical protein ISS52_02755 [Dehalococcoidia bacterium]|nr:hypothetical protein [Dehalococcoidia bacterium]
MKKCKWYCILAVGVLVPLLACCLVACKAPAEFEEVPAPAEFEVVSLDVTPPEVRAGDSVSVTAEVKNIGGSEGVYTATLTIDGAQVETKDVSVAPGGTETASFSLVKDEAGTYQVAVGDLSSSLVVQEKAPVFVAKEIELKYDDAWAEGSLAWIGGYLVDFSPPTVPFVIDKICICGCLYGNGLEDFNFEMEIWDKNQSILYTATYPVNKFGICPPSSLVELEVPGIEVMDTFYVHIWRGICKGRTSPDGLLICVDDTPVNEHSQATIRTHEGTNTILDYWPYSRSHPNEWFGDKSKVNWMIRVVGTIMVPEE